MRIKTFLSISLFVFLIAQQAEAQHEHHGAPKKDTAKPVIKPTPKPAMKMDTTGGEHAAHRNESRGLMSHAFSRQLPMNRNGSGTAWLPDNAPMYGYMFHTKKWMYMLHGNLFLRYNNQDIARVGSRGAHKFDAPNWIMGMGQTAVGKNGLFRFSAMVSFDRMVMGGAGYPLLFQSGETWKGEPLVDRQHPHDLVAELSAGYTHAISKEVDVFA